MIRAAVLSLIAFGLWAQQVPSVAQSYESSSTSAGGITQPGTWSLTKLGQLDARLTPEHPDLSVPIELPANATQGPNLWWQIYSEFSIRFASRVSAPLFFTASVNGAASASVTFTTPAGGGLAWQEVDLDGSTHASATTLESTVTMSNFIQREGIRGGSGQITFSILDADGSSPTPGGLAEIDITTARSGLIWSADSPLQGSIHVSEPAESPTPGHTYAVTCTTTIQTDGTSSTQDLTVAASSAQGGLTMPDGPAHFKANGRGEYVQTLQLQMSGDAIHYPILISVSTARGKRVASQLLDVYTTENGQARRTDRIWLLICSGGLVAVGIGLLSSSRYFHRPRSASSGKHPLQRDATP